MRRPSSQGPDTYLSGFAIRGMRGASVSMAVSSRLGVRAGEVVVGGW